MKSSKLVIDFIDQVWNKQDFSQLDSFLHPDFVDNSLPLTLPPNKEGLKNWVIGTSASFEHKTIVEDQVTEDNKSVLKINLKHIGRWRDFEATGIELQTVGYRLFKIKDDLIAEHWALLDGQSIENQIRDSSHGCKIAK